MEQKIIRTGNSAAVTIPARFLKFLNLRVGDRVVARADFEGGTLTYTFLDVRQLHLSAGQMGRGKKRPKGKR